MNSVPARPRILLFQCLLFGSGFSALVYQAIWVKQLSLVVGVDVYAISTGVSAFFAGLALGGAIFGRLADSLRNPLRLYAVLEFLIAVIGIGATLALAKAPAIFVALQSQVGVLAWLLPFLLVMFPAILMGGTLPPLISSVRPGNSQIGRTAGQLYTANTAGAIIGVLLTALALVPLFGVKGAAFFAGALNVLLGIWAFVLSRAKPQVRTSEAPRERLKFFALSSKARLALVLYALAGGVALGYEVLWTQIIVQFLSTRAVAFSVVLAVYLSGLVIGSFLYSRFADRVRARWTTFGLLVLGAGFVAMATFSLLGPWLLHAQEVTGLWVFDVTGNRMAQMLSRFIVAAGVIIFPSTLLLGAAFPAAARLVVDEAKPGQDIGLMLALNTACGIVGTLGTGFILVPWLGLSGSLAVLAVLAGLVGAVALYQDRQRFTPAPAFGLLALVVALAVWLPRDLLTRLLTDSRGGEVVFYEEAPGGTVAVLEQDSKQGSFRRLYIQGVSNTGDAMPSLRYMRLQALLPLLVHPGEPKSALVIGLGTGITAGSTLVYPELDRRLCIELMKPVADAVTLFKGNLGAGKDPRLDIQVGDGRHELMRSKELFDLITLEPPPPAAAGVVNLYSSDFYELAKVRLSEGGILAQWLPIATQTEADTRSLIRSMLDVFPHVSLWTTEANEMMLLGSEKPLALDIGQIEQRMQRGDVASTLQEVGIGSVTDLLATYITDRKGLESYVKNAQPVTDNRPLIEYGRWTHAEQITYTLPSLLELREKPQFQGNEVQMSEVEASYLRLVKFYQIYLYATMGDTNSWKESVRRFVRGDNPNAYYDWFLPPAS